MNNQRVGKKSSESEGGFTDVIVLNRRFQIFEISVRVFRWGLFECQNDGVKVCHDEPSYVINYKFGGNTQRYHFYHEVPHRMARDM